MKQILHIKRGSQVYGVATPTSDTDTSVIFKYNLEDYILGKYSSHKSIDKDNTGVEVGAFIENLARGSISDLELLYTPEEFIIEKNPVVDILFENRDKFLTNILKKRYLDLVQSNLQKFKQKKSAQTIEDFCCVFSLDKLRPLSFWLEDFNWKIDNLTITSTPLKDFYILYKSLKKTGLVDENGVLRVDKDVDKVVKDNHREFAFVGYLQCNHSQYMSSQKTKVETRNYKLLYHALRHINTCYELFSGKGLVVDRRGLDAGYLLKVKSGEVKEKKVFKHIENMTIEINKLENCFQDVVDPDFVNSLILKLRN